MESENLYLYIHIPFCNSKCPYCSFYSITDHTEELHKIYINTVIKELELYNPLLDFKSRILKSIYIGGGTPSILSEKNLDFILKNIHSLFPGDENTEITIEGNPESLNYENLNFYKNSGINRLSLGLQSSMDKNLRTLGRNHRLSEINNILSIIKELNFPSVSVDFIYNIPGQTMDDLKKEFEFIKIYKPEHLSFYGLSIEENTPFCSLYKNYDAQEELYNNMYMEISEKLLSMGYEHYEISNFALPGHGCRHNMAYWDFSEYLGLGPSASSYIDEKRFKNSSSIKDYINNIKNKNLAINNPEKRNNEDLLLEKIFLGLRTKSGINLEGLCREYNLNLQELRDKIKYYIPETLWICSDNELSLTTEGFLLSNTITVEVFNLFQTSGIYRK